MTRRYRRQAHWFLDRWCAEIVVEDWLPVQEAVRRTGTDEDFVARAVRRVHGCSIVAARLQYRRRRERRA